ncbi:MAG TPA: NAD-dependent epimerase/dehydratase family protein [Thermodesulfobacteriota bacterium]|nr:NAD-dependent epimerase/dehydratase family protein [Thermodesulfobacteriota bacterium]
MLRILVTGGAGFIGSHLVDRYVAEGHAVTVVDNLSTGKREQVNPAATFHELDILDPALETVMAEGRFDVVNHQAAQVDVRKSVADPLRDAEINILGTLRLLELSRRYGVRRFLFASSGGAAYGEQLRFPADEDHPLNPISPYGVAKVSAEHYCYYYRAVHGLSYVALRYANVYGPRQDPHGEAGVVAIFAGRLLAGQPCVINGDGRQTRDYVYVGDVVEANVAATPPNCPVEGPINIGTGIETDVNTLFARLVAVTGLPGEATHGPAKAGEQRRSVLDASRAARLLGWQPRTPLDEGLRRTVAHVRAAVGRR